MYFETSIMIFLWYMYFAKIIVFIPAHFPVKFYIQKQDCLFVRYAHVFMAPLILHIHLFLTICLQLLYMYMKYSKSFISNIGYM